MSLDSERKEIIHSKIDKLVNNVDEKCNEEFSERTEKKLFSPKWDRDIYKTFFGINGVLPINFTEKIVHINPQISQIFESIFAQEIHSKYYEYACIKHSEWLLFVEKNKKVAKKVRILPLPIENKIKKIGNTYIGKIIPKKIAIEEYKIMGILGKITLSLGRFELPLWH